MTWHRKRLQLAPAADRPRKVSVLFVIDSLGHGGAEHLLAEYLRHLPRLGITPRVLILQERDGNPIARRIEKLGVPVAQLGIRRLRQRGALGEVEAAIAAAAPDVVHTQLEFANILGTEAAHRLGIPVVSTIHTLDRPRRWSRAWLRFRIMSWMLRRRCDRVICVSEGTRRHILGLARLRRRGVVTLHNGIDLSPFAHKDGDARRRVRAALGIDHAAPVAATVAVLREAKGIQHMIRALPAVVETLPEMRYLIAGDGEHREALESEADALGLSDRIIFSGMTDDVPSLLAAVDVFILPSLTEALPTVVIEAMAAGLPVVATDVGGIREMVGHGTSGLIVPPADPAALADATVRILVSRRQASAMGMTGVRLAAERFDVHRQARRLVDEYRFVAAARAAR